MEPAAVVEGSGRRKRSAKVSGDSGAGAAKAARKTGRPKKRSGAGAADAEAGAEEENPGLLLTDLVSGDPEESQAALRKAARVRRKAATAGKSRRKAPVEDEDEDDDEDDVDPARLFAAVGDLDADAAAASAAAAAAAMEPAERPAIGPESEFHAGAVEEISVEDLLAPLGETSGLGEARRQLQNLARTEPLPEPVSDVKRSREERDAQYASTSKDVSKWIPQVQRMRRAEQIVLGEEKDNSANVSTQGIVGSFRPVDDFEKELEAAIESAGTTEKEMKGGNVLPVNSVIRGDKEIRQVAKLKMLMLREQQAAKRVKKIKSKAFRRIHRKGETKDREALLERLEVENPELAKALKEEYEKKHAQQRLLRQRNARRKWAQTMQRFAKGDNGARKEITKQAQKHRDEEQALRRAVRGKRADQSEDSEAVDFSESDGDDEDDGSLRKQTMKKAKKLTKEQIDGLGDDDDLPTKGIMGLGFMRDAIKRKREAAKAEAENVLRELEGLDQKLDDADDSDAEGAAEGAAAATEDARGKAAGAGKAKKRMFTPEELEEARKQVDEILDREDMATECTVSGPLTVQGVAAAQVLPAANFRSKPSGGSAAGAAGSPAAAPAAAPGSPAAVARSPAKSPATAPAGKRKANKAAKVPAVAAEDNPWLAEAGATEAAAEADDADDGSAEADGEAADVEASGAKKKVVKKVKKVKKKKARPAAAAAENSDSDGEGGAEGPPAEATVEGVLNVLSQESEAAREQRDLVRTAFVRGTQEEDFDAELEAAELEKEEKSKKSDALVGWGSWAGEGIAPRKPKGEGKGKKRRGDTGDAPGGAAANGAAPARPKVTFYEGANKVSGKYFADKVPFPYQSPDQYNQELRMPSGPEWNTLDSHLNRIKPKVCLRAGTIVAPLQYVKHLDPEKRESAIEAWSKSKQPKRLKARF
eukprot:TRINITY_DN12501_c0_g1_i2.p1 TRINITY_DN12501_c0_g1~~TRINITY_DN12501_c0_g1_i2.p1  ORF type:complete len:932 (+),score=329.22 TRINITY_DN12501_c0_g1_i2:60-2855(+)